MKQSLFLLLLFFSIFPALSRQNDFFDVGVGLSSSTLNSIIQDSDGYLWIATQDGLNRFDGNEFSVFRNIPNDTSSLIHNNIMSLCQDHEGIFWIGTSGGLCIYDKTTEKFSPYKIPYLNDDRELLLFYYLIEDKHGYIWAAVSGNGIVRIDAKKRQFLYFNTLNSGICSDHINKIYEDRFGNLWFGSGQEGLSVYNPTNGTFRTFKYNPSDNSGISANEISSICEDCEGNVWIGTMGGGINIYDFKTQSFRKSNYHHKKVSYLYKDKKQNIWIGTMGNGFDLYSCLEKNFIICNDESINVNLEDSKVETIYEDRQGNIWLGLFMKGLYIIPYVKEQFNNLTFNPYSSSKSIGDGAVQPILIDSHNELWASVDGKGIYRFDRNMNLLNHYSPGDKNKVAESVPLTFCEDNKGNIWIGTYINGIIRFDRKENRFENPIPFNSNGLRSNHIKDIEQDKDGKLWIATNGDGVTIYDPQTKQFQYLTKDDSKDFEDQIIYNYCTMVHVGYNDIVWIGTFRGLCSYNQKTKHFTYYTVNNNMLPDNTITFIKEDSKNNIWVGTRDGLVCFDSSNKLRRVYSINDGLPNNIINGIEEDKDGRMWIMTNNGLSSYNELYGKFVNYNMTDGLITGEFTKDAVSISQDGTIFLGSMKGVIYFNPSKNSTNTIERKEPLNLFFKDLYVFNNKVEIGDSIYRILQKEINYSDKLRIKHSQNSFSIDFSAIEFINPQNVKYEVMLEGFDQKWIVSNNKRVTYTNLNSGNYTLLVRAWTKDKDNTIVKSLNIVIMPPLWSTIWAKMLYVVLFILVVLFIYRYTDTRVKLKRQARITQEKLQFFTDISHEIRTPLTLILSSLTKLINLNSDNSLNKIYYTMHRNSLRLLQLVNQVIDIRAIEFGGKKLYVEETDIVTFVKDLKCSFNNLAEEKELEYSINSLPEKIIGYIDHDVISKILFNLISNAFKFTEKGNININLKLYENSELRIDICDTGKGISNKFQKQIFERFFTTGENGQFNSSGIGLHLVNKLIKLHHGKICLESKEGEGSCFSVFFPISKERYCDDEFKTFSNTNISYTATDSSEITQESDTSQKNGYQFRDYILIADDSKDIRDLIKSEFGSKYKVLEADNGKDALRMAIDKVPTLIISDVMMPQVNGLELCKNIKNNERTYHIPFLILTACSSSDNQIQGLENGADDYITKPFDVSVLRTKVEYMIKNRRKLKERLKQDISQESTKDTTCAVKNQNDKLLTELRDIIENKIGDSSLNVEVLCKELALSRTHLNRKIKELTNESPASYIKRIRLQKSALLLKSGDLTISEIAFSVGFSSSSYFSQAFRDYYGLTPKEYITMD